MTNHLPQTNSLTLLLEPRVMFDAAAAATVSEVAAQADASHDAAVQAADHSPVNASASDTKITVDKTGQATSADLFKDVSVSDIADGKTYDAVTIKVSGVEAGSLVINGDSLKLSHGQSLTLKGGDYDGLRADVVRNDDGSFTVTVQITGLGKGEVAGLLDGLKLNVDGTQQTSEQVTVTLESISYMNESDADTVDISTTISVTSRFNFAPEIDSSSDLSVADQITAAGIGTGADIVSSADGSTAFVRDADGKICAFQVIDGKLQEVGKFDTSSIEGFGSLKSMVVSGKGDRLFLCNNSNIYVLKFDGEKQSLTYTGFSASTGGAPYGGGDCVMSVAGDGDYVLVLNGLPEIWVFKVGIDGSLEKTDSCGATPNPNFMAVVGNYVYTSDSFSTSPWYSQDICQYKLTSDGRLERLSMITNAEVTRSDGELPKEGDGSEDGSKFFILTTNGRLLSFIGQGDTFAKGVTTTLTGVIDFKVTTDGKYLYTLSNNGEVVKYSVGEDGSLSKVGATGGLVGAKGLDIGSDGTVIVSGEKTWRLVPEKTGTWGTSVDFSSGLTLTDRELDRANDYDGAKVTVVSSDTKGTYVFSSDNYELKANGIYKDGTLVAKVKQSNGELHIAFSKGCTAEDANSILKGWRYNTGSGGDSSNVTLSVTFFDDGNKTSDTQIIDLVIADNSAPSASWKGEAEKTFDTAGDELTIFDKVNVSAGEAGQLIETITIGVSGLVNVDAGEYITVDDIKIALNKSSSGTTASGYAYVYTVNSDGTASLRLNFGKGADVQTISNLISSAVYGNGSVAGETDKGLSGDRIFSVIHIKDIGGTTGAGVDSTDIEGISVEIKLSMNSAPEMTVNADQFSDLFDTGEIYNEGQGTNFTNDIKISEDGKTVLVIGSLGSKADNGTSILYVFSRDPATGKMTLVEQFSQSDTTDGLNRMSSVAFSADGKYVYVAGYSTDSNVYSLVIFKRGDDGHLTYVGKTATQGVDGVAGLDGWIGEIVVSADGKTLYTVNGKDALNKSTGKTALSVFSIGEDGSLHYLQTITENISAPTDIEISSDGTTVFVVNNLHNGKDTNVITVFSRNAETGKLTYLSDINTDQAKGCIDIAVSKDGSHIYAITGNQKLLVFDKDGSGAYKLSQQEPMAGNSYVPGGSIALSPDGKALYYGAGYLVMGVKVYSIDSDGKVSAAGSIAASTNHIQGSQLALSSDGKTLIWGGYFGWGGVSAAQISNVIIDTGNGASVGAALLISDRDSDANSNYAGTQITLVRQGGANDGDEFTFKTSDDLTVKDGKIYWQGKEIGTAVNEGGKLTLSFTATGVTSTVVNSVLDAVVYKAANLDGIVKLTATVKDAGGKEASAVLSIQSGDLAIDAGSDNSNAYDKDNGTQIFPNISVSVSADMKADGLTVTVSCSDVNADFTLKSGDYAFDTDGKVYRTGSDGVRTEIGSYEVKDGKLTLFFSKDAKNDDLAGVLQSLIYKTSGELKESVSFDVTLTDSEDNKLIEVKDAAEVYVNQAPVWGGAEADAVISPVYPGDKVLIKLDRSLFTDPEGSSLTYEISGLPDGLAFDPTTMTISGTAPSDAKDFTLTFKATDRDGASTSQDITLKVTTDANRAPQPTADFVVDSGKAGSSYSQNWSGMFTDPDGDKMTYEISGLPEGLSWSDAGVVSGIPQESGTFTVTVTATDSKGHATKYEFKLTVDNLPPKLTDGAALPDGAAKEIYDVDLSTIFTDPEGHDMSFDVSGLPKGLEVKDGKIVGTPLESGTFKITVKATDKYGATSEAATFEITVPNDAPAFNGNYGDYVMKAGTVAKAISGSGAALPDDLFTDDFGVTKWGVIKVTDSDGNEVSLSDIGLTFDAGKHAFTGTPTKEGTYTITVEVSDVSGETTSHDIKLTIEPNVPPEINADATDKELVFNAQGKVDLNDLFLDTDEDGLTYELVGELPAGLSYNDLTNTITGTAKEAGTFKLVLKASDGVNDPVSREFTLTIRGNAFPVPDTDAGTPTVVKGSSASVSLKDFFKDPDGDDISFDVITGTVDGEELTLPDGMQFDAETGRIYGTPSATGTYRIGVEVTDQYGESQTYYLNIVVRGNDAPVGVGTAAIVGDVGGDVSANLRDFFRDPNGDGFTLELVSPAELPDGFTFDPATGRFTGHSDTALRFDLTVKCTDAYGAEFIRTVAVDFRVASVSFADPGVWNPASGMGLDLIRNPADETDLERPLHEKTELAADRPGFVPMFGADGFVTEVTDCAAALPTPADTALAAFDRMLDDEHRAAEEKAVQSAERRVEKATEKLPVAVRSTETVSDANEKTAEIDADFTEDETVSAAANDDSVTPHEVSKTLSESLRRHALFNRERIFEDDSEAA